MQGVWEKDEIRKDDSFLTFEEIFDVAKREKVTLLSSDLITAFYTIPRVLELLIMYTMHAGRLRVAWRGSLS